MTEQTTAKFRLGEDVFVRDPKRFKPDANSIIGHISEFELREDGYWYHFANQGHPADGEWAWYAERDIGHRIGTPLSQLSGRPGHAGYDKFCEIASSWGYN